jgi:hypothetical protein
VAAFLLGTAVTPAGIILGWLAPRPLDAIVALPLVLVDIWAASGIHTGATETPSQNAAFVRLFLLALGIVLTWLFHVLVVRLVLWRLVPRAADGHSRRRQHD